MDRESFRHATIAKSQDQPSRLSASERDWLAIRHLCGETYVNGIVGYFEIYGHDYATTRELLLYYGFAELARVLDSVVGIIFKGTVLSDPQINRECVARYEAQVEDTGHDEVELFKDEICAHLRRLDAVADETARAAGLFT